MQQVLEIAAFITGISGIWLTMKQKIWCFPVGLVNVGISFYIFLTQKLYADSLQQVMYMILLSYGWYSWNRPLKFKKTLPVSHLETREGLLCAAVSILFTLLLGMVLKTYTQASYPWPDSFATALAFTAQYLIARKKIENWILWMIVNCIYIIIYIEKSLLLYAILFTVYLLLSFMGFFQWKKELQTVSGSDRP